MFSPKLFISTGKTNAMFTLRETYKDIFTFEIRSIYLANLSTDPDLAMEKALIWSKDSGIELATTRQDLSDQLREIERMLDGMSKAERFALEKAEADAAWKAKSDIRMHDCLDRGEFPFGAHQGLLFAAAPRSYITWVYNTEFEQESGMWYVQIAVRATCSHLLLPTPDKTLTAGTIGKREVFNVEVIRVGGFFGTYGYINIITMITDKGACMVSKGAFQAAVGDKLTIKGTVKEYSEYKEQMQTVVQRIAII
jgi:hypothetical protein